MRLTESDIRDLVSYHAPSEAGVERHAILSDAFQTIMRVVSDVVPVGREQSIVFTKLEEAKMWASAGVARNSETR